MKNFTLILAFIFCYIFAYSQDFDGLSEGDFVTVQLYDGSRIRGEIKNVGTTFIEIESNSMGLTPINLDQIKSIKKSKNKIENGYSGKYENPFYSKYIISESAIGLEEGRGYYQNILIVGNVISYGLTNNISITAGFESVSIFQGESPGVLFGAKFTTGSISDKLHFGVGANLVTAFRSGFGGSVYGITTYGSRNNNITVGLGYGYIDDDFADSPVVQLGGIMSISDQFALVMDNLLVGVNGNLEGFGTFTARYMTQTIAIDLGVLAVYSEFAVPVLGAAIAF